MAETLVVCPQCSTKLKLKGDVAGKKVKCPKCQTAFRINATNSPTSPPPQISPTSSPSPRPTTRTAKPQPPRSQNDQTSKSPTPRRSQATGSVRTPRSSNRKPSRGKSVSDNFYDESAFDEFDDFGEDLAGGYDDGYQDYGGVQSLPGRKKKKKKKSSKNSKTSGSSGSLQEAVSNMGVLGWVLFAAAGGLVSIFLTTLTGFTNIWLVISLMALVTGVLVGGCVRFAADHNQGWGPGLLAGAVALVCILTGRVGAFYVADTMSMFGDGDDWTMQDEIAEATTESALISDEANAVNTEWLESGRITQAQLEVHAQKLEEDYEEDYEEGVDVEYDHSVNYLPEVWSEATERWNSKTAEERSQIVEQKTQQIRDDWGEGEEVMEDAAERIQLFVAIGMTVFSLFFTKSGFVLFVTGVWTAFRIGSNLGDDE
ncbi:MAG: hypothetical protein R3C59_30270 [Planctomycetaceae bacterium]